MATYLSVNDRTIGRWEQDKHEPPFSVVVRWADVCHVPLEWIADAVDAGGRRFAQRRIPGPGQLDLFAEQINLRDVSHIAELLADQLVEAALAA